MQNYFQLKARTLENYWQTFSIANTPVEIAEGMAVLLSKPNSPIILSKDIRRGEWEYNLFEGDIVESEDTRYLICYERGFYAIDENYTIKNLYQLKDPKVLGVKGYELDFPVHIKLVKTHMFKCFDIKFYIRQITRTEGDCIVLKAKGQAVPIQLVQQECCLSYEKQRIYLGDFIEDKKVEMHGGRICIETDAGYLDLATGGILDGYISKAVG